MLKEFMPMRIVLDGHSPSNEYYPGDQITGNVVVTFQNRQTIAISRICFRGKIETEYCQNRGAATTPVRVYRKETIRLFELNQTLFTGPYEVQAQSLEEWPFSFTIPTHVDCRRTRGNTNDDDNNHNNNYNSHSGGFIEDGSSPLPSSFCWDSKSYTRDACAYIKYKLVATVDSGNMDMFTNHKLELPILITRLSTSTYRPPPPQMSTYEYLPPPRWSSRALRARGHTIKQKFRHITSNDPELQTPCLSFKAYIHFPASLSPQQNTSVAFSVTPLRITPNDPEAPNLMLNSLSLTLQSHTAMVVSGPSSSSRDRFAEDLQYEAGHNVCFEPVMLPLDGTEVILRDDICLDRWRPGRSWHGSFSTYTVRRDYYMKVDAKVQHADTGHVFSLSTEFPFYVLDMHPDEVYEMRLLGSQDGGATNTRIVNGGFWNGDLELAHPPPPPYDADVMPPGHDEE